VSMTSGSERGEAGSGADASLTRVKPSEPVGEPTPQPDPAAEKPAFRAEMRRRRCLIVADGFYEWQRSGRKKQPYFIHLRGDRPFAFAGVWEAWEGPDHSMLETCTILTTAANDVVRPIHDRMPVILDASDYAAWLDPANKDPERLVRLLQPYPSEAMEAQAVGDFVNSPSRDSPQCVEPAMQKGNITLPGFWARHGVPPLP